MKLSVQIKLQPTKEQAESLEETLVTANKACNYISEIAWEEKTFGKKAIHDLVYYDIREKFGLPSQIAIRAYSKVYESYQTDHSCRHYFKEKGALAFDERNHRVYRDKKIVSISTIGGRLKIPFVCGERQEELLQSKHGESNLVLIDGEWYLFVSIEVEEPPEEVVDYVLGVDFGIKNIATDSTGDKFEGQDLKQARGRYSRLRANLQQAGTKSAKRHLRKLSGKERNFVKTLNHTIAKRIVEKAQRHSCAIALEELGGIKQETTVRREQRHLHESWPYHQLRSFVEYKAKLAGVPLHVVDPKHTSQTCPECGYQSSKNRKTQSSFQCQFCGYAGHADTIAAINIADKADVSLPIAVCCESNSPFYGEPTP